MMSMTHLLRLKLEHEVRVSGYEVVDLILRHYLLKNVQDPVFYTMRSMYVINEGQLRAEPFTKQDIAKVQEIICTNNLF